METLSKPIKVLHIIDHLGLGGAQRFLVDLVCHINSSKFQLIVCSLSKTHDDIFIRSLREAKVKTILLDRTRWDIRKLYDVTRIVREERPFIIHTHLTAASIIGRLSGLILRVPVIVQHDQSANEYQVMSPLLFKFLLPIDRILNIHTDLTIACSESVKAFDQQIRGIRDNKIAVIHNHVDLEQFDPGKFDKKTSRNLLGIYGKEIVIGSVGRLTHLKGVSYLIGAFSSLCADGLDVKLVIVGDGPQRNHLRSQAMKLGIADRVIFTGYRDEVPKIMKAFDIFVLPSISEPFGMVVTEAMAMKLPVVATKVGGVPEIIYNNKNGLVVSKKSKTAIANAIRYLIENPEIRKKMSIAAKKMAKERFSLKRMIDEVENAYGLLEIRNNKTKAS